MEIQLFDTELNMTPIDMSKLPEESETKVEEVLKDDPEKEYTIIENIVDKAGEEEATEEKEETKNTKEKPASEQSADSSKIPYSTLAKALYEEGVISFYDEDEFKKLVEETGSEVDAVIELNRQTIAEQVEGYKNSLTPEGKKFLEALEQGVPLDKYIQAKTSEYQYNQIKDTTLADDDDLCKDLIREDLLTKGFDEDEIKDQIKDIDALGKLEAKAKTALKRLKSLQQESIDNEKLEAQKRQQAAIESNKKQMQSIKTEIDKLVEIVPGQKLNAKIKGQLYDAITTPAEQLENGQWVNAVYAKRSKDPIAWDIKLAYLDSIGVFDGKWDKVLGSAKSAATKELAEKLKGGSISGTGEPNAPEGTPKAKDVLRSMGVFQNKK